MGKKKRNSKKQGKQHQNAAPKKEPSEPTVPEETSPQIIYSSFAQTDTEITFLLEVQDNVNPDFLTTEFTDTEASIAIKDAGEWSCVFHQTVERLSASVRVQSNKVVVTLKKTKMGYDWPQLQKIDGQIIENTSDCLTGDVTMPTQSATTSDSPPVPSTSAAETTKETTKSKDTTETCSSSIYELRHVKHDYFEKGGDRLILHVYVKDINPGTVSVLFEPGNLTITFNTTNSPFLKLHDRSKTNTCFRWLVTLSNKILVDECQYQVKATMLEITLRKATSQKWKSLEALSMPSPVLTPISLASEDKSWTPLSTDNKSGSGKKQVSFDEMDIGTPVRESSASVVDGQASSSSKKPTCMVPPHSGATSAVDTKQVVPFGMTGLDNLGNTCFMNSVIQCLSNTTPLRDYFLVREFQKDLNQDNPLGYGGKLAISFAILMRILWSGKARSHAPMKLKHLVAQKASQFAGYAQHDAQEFMAFLLDGLHEDLNRVKKKPYTTTVESNGRADNVVADEAWDVHKQRNDSYITDLFHGQYKSTLVCPVCGKNSIVFDPFTIMSVPMPKRHFLLPCIFMSRDSARRPIRLVLRISRETSVEQFTELVSSRVDVPASQLRVYEIYQHAVHQIFRPGSSMSSVSPHDKIIVSEILTEQVVGESVVELAVTQHSQVPMNLPTHCTKCAKSSTINTDEGIVTKPLRRCTRCYRAAYCSTECQRTDWTNRHHVICRPANPEPVGVPFILTLPRSQATYANLVTRMQAFSRLSVDIFQPPVSPTCDTPPSSTSFDPLPTQPDKQMSVSSQSETCDIDEGIGEEDADVSHEGMEDDTVFPAATSPSRRMQFVTGRAQDVPNKDQLPFTVRTLPGVNNAGSIVLEERGDTPLDLTNVRSVAMDWKNSEKCRPYVIVESKEMEHDDDESVESTSLEGFDSNSLEQCLERFAEPEVLNPDDAWYCPSCKEHRQARKEMSIWRLPEIFIIQFKRFSFRNMLWRDKIDKLIKFPTRGLDMSPYCQGESMHTSDAVYDLYGVINHHGGIMGGHYTSYVRCQDSKQPGAGQDDIGWRLCDDSLVSETEEKSVVTRAAYLLFYRRRPANVSLVTSPGLPPRMDSEEDEDFQDVNSDMGYMAPSSSSPPSSDILASDDLPLEGDDLDLPLGHGVPHEDLGHPVIPLAHGGDFSLRHNTYQSDLDSCSLPGMDPTILASAPNFHIPTVVSEMDDMETEVGSGGGSWPGSVNSSPEVSPLLPRRQLELEQAVSALHRSCSYTDMDAVD